MKFNEKLNEIMKKINANQSDLVKNSNLSSSVISRYCNGTRTPKYNSKQLNELINSLYKISIQNNIKNISLESLKNDFNSLYDIINIEPETFVKNFNSIIDTLNIKIYELASFIDYDPSYISKIRNEYILPRNITNFSSQISKYITTFFNDDISKKTLCNILNCNIEDINTDDKYSNKITLYLCNNNTAKSKDSTFEFLKELDNFDLNEFYNQINFEKKLLPILPIERHKTKEYYGLKGYKKAQEEMLKTIILSKSKEDIFFYSNMSIANASKDSNFKTKFIKGISYILKKGIHINMVHDIDRPFEELMIGLVGWIPLYMTGMINPYYFKNNQNNLYKVIKITSGTASLFGIGVSGNMNNAKFTLSTKPTNVKHSKDNSEQLLKKANPLMKIYTSENKDKFNDIVNETSKINANRRNILYNLPIYTIEEKLLDKILNRNKINSSDKKIIKKYYHKEQNRIKEILKNNTILDEFNINQVNQKLSLSGLFYNKEITYTESEFKKHLNNIKDFKKNNKNYNYLINNKYVFKNININIIENNSVIISKAKSRAITFYITHPKLVSTINKLNINLLN